MELLDPWESSQKFEAKHCLGATSKLTAPLNEDKQHLNSLSLFEYQQLNLSCDPDSLIPKNI